MAARRGLLGPEVINHMINQVLDVQTAAVAEMLERGRNLRMDRVLRERDNARDRLVAALTNLPGADQEDLIDAVNIFDDLTMDSIQGNIENIRQRREN